MAPTCSRITHRHVSTPIPTPDYTKSENEQLLSLPKVKLTSNLHRLQLHCDIYAYSYSITIPESSHGQDDEELLKLEASVMVAADKELKDKLKVFATSIPASEGLVWSPTKVEDFKVPVEVDKHGECTLSLTHKFTVTSDTLKKQPELARKMQVVFRAVVRGLSAQTKYDAVGRRYYKLDDKSMDKQQLQVYNGFYASVYTTNSYGSLLVFEITPRVLYKRNLFDSIESERDNMTDQQMMEEWVKRCHGAIVVTHYNNRVYRVKRVRFDKTPKSTFTHRDRESGEKVMTFQEYHHVYYGDIKNESQPMLEAYAEKASEEVFLVPEMCQITGFTDDLRKDRNLLQEAVKLSKVIPEERFADDVPPKDLFFQGIRDGTQAPADMPDPLKDWGLTLERNAHELDGMQLPQLQVKFGTSVHAIEEGNFQRWMRNGLEDPVTLEDWLLIYPDSDGPVIDIWLRSLKDIAQVAFTMKMPDPRRVVCADQVTDLVETLDKHITPKTRMILLLAQQKDFKRVYSISKKHTLCHTNCVTQVVRSETIRKRQSIASVLSRIVLQINAKCGGALWHIKLSDKEYTTPFFDVSHDTMCIGVDIYYAPQPNSDRKNAHECSQLWLGFAASLDDNAAKYYSRSQKLEWKPREGNEEEHVYNASALLKEFFWQALTKFRTRSTNTSKTFPRNIVVYRNSVEPHEWDHILKTEVAAFKHVLDKVKQKVCEKEIDYNPGLTFVTVRRREHARFCVKDGKKNLAPGTVIDCPEVALGGFENFMLVNQAVTKGVACPTHYTILSKASGISRRSLQNITYRLSYLYFNYTGSVRLPAPAQYAKKIANLHGSAIQSDEPIKEHFAESLYYL
mmetsp:Transcript_54243/g.129286  ORF Transcript_54243/g.129286 Transcript_54243/m.129286 type:complete len:850 (+) Transcript_54243:138-2687(+)